MVSTVNHFSFQSETRAQTLSERNPFRREIKSLWPETVMQQGIKRVPSDAQHNKSPVGKTSCYGATAYWVLQQHLSFFFLQRWPLLFTQQEQESRASFRTVGKQHTERGIVLGLGTENYEKEGGLWQQQWPRDKHCAERLSRSTLWWLPAEMSVTGLMCRLSLPICAGFCPF